MEKIILSYQESGLVRAQPLRKGPRPPANISGFFDGREINTISAQMMWKRYKRWYPCRTESSVIPFTLEVQKSVRKKLVNNFAECNNFFTRVAERELGPTGCNLVTSFLPPDLGGVWSALWWPSILTKKMVRFVLRFRKRRGKKHFSSKIRENILKP